jgi:hypothetical protein
MDFNRVEEAKNTGNQWQSSEIPYHNIQRPRALNLNQAYRPAMNSSQNLKGGTSKAPNVVSHFCVHCLQMIHLRI